MSAFKPPAERVEKFTVCMPPEMSAYLRQDAGDRGVSASELVRIALSELWEREGGEGPSRGSTLDRRIRAISRAHERGRIAPPPPPPTTCTKRPAAKRRARK